MVQDQAHKRREQMFRLLLSHPRVNASCVDDDGATLWFHALYGMDEASLPYLLQHKDRLPSLNHQAS